MEVRRPDGSPGIIYVKPKSGPAEMEVENDDAQISFLDTDMF
jgi:hypothetical protein